jgi:phosphatidylserine decarboxylase
MLDSLGSTLSRSTVDSFFTRHNNRPDEEDLTLAEAIQCLETELGCPDSERKRIDSDDSLPGTSVSTTPNLMLLEESFKPLSLGNLDPSGLSFNVNDVDISPTLGGPQPLTPKPGDHATENSADAGFGYGRSVTVMSVVGQSASSSEPVTPQVSSSSSDAEDSSSSASNNNSPTSSDALERVIDVKSCPLWIKGREFTVARLLGDSYQGQADKYADGVLAIYSVGATRLPSIPLSCGWDDWAYDLYLRRILYCQCES